MQRVQASMRRAAPLTSTEVFWMFGNQRRLVFRFEWLTLWPKDTFLPHRSQRFGTALETHFPGANGEAQLKVG
jgi:hypothetical protein